jgi:hypothetical protein
MPTIPFLETCNNLPDHKCEWYDAKVVTVIAGWMGSGNIQLTSGCYAFDAFYHHPKAGVVEDNDITRAGVPRQKGDFGNEHKIPFIIDRLEAFAGNLEQPQH